MDSFDVLYKGRRGVLYADGSGAVRLEVDVPGGRRGGTASTGGGDREGRDADVIMSTRSVLSCTPYGRERLVLVWDEEGEGEGSEGGTRSRVMLRVTDMPAARAHATIMGHLSPEPVSHYEG